MPSIVDICNTSLSHIGDTANVASIDPPDGSVQAGYCATYYPIARDALLEMASWGFATRRIALASVDNPSTTWLYAYAYPSQVVNLIAVLCPEALDDYSQNFGVLESSGCFLPFPDRNFANPAANFYTPQSYASETGADGNLIILTNVQNAIARYTMLVDDANKFSPLFVLALTYLLASMLAGPIIKGDAGSAKSKEMLQLFQMFEAQAESSDANQRRINLQQSVPWMAGR